MIKRTIITIYLSCGFLLSITPQAVHTLPILKTNPIDFYKPKVLEVFNVEVKAVVDLTVKKNSKVADVEIVEFQYDKYDLSLQKSLNSPWGFYNSPLFFYNLLYRTQLSYRFHKKFRNFSIPLCDNTQLKQEFLKASYQK